MSDYRGGNYLNLACSPEHTLQLLSQKDLGRRSIGRCVFTIRGDGFFSNWSMPGKISSVCRNTRVFNEPLFPGFLNQPFKTVLSSV